MVLMIRMQNRMMKDQKTIKEFADDEKKRKIRDRMFFIAVKRATLALAE